jgi:hypothetical protein
VLSYYPLELNQLAETAQEESENNDRRTRTKAPRTKNRTMKLNTNRELRRQKSEEPLALRRSKVSY